MELDDNDVFEADSVKTEGFGQPLTSAISDSKKESKGQTAPSWDAIASKLLSEKLLLTALELHGELIELGKETPRLANFFSNPANFDLTAAPTLTTVQSITNISRSCSQTTLDSLEWTYGGSEDGGEDKVALLEFELRKARETIQALRNTLTQSTASTTKTSDSNGNTSPEESAGDFPSWPGVGLVNSNGHLQPLQKATINFLVGEYLSSQGYRMAAITFAEEDGNQEFDNWDDVGLNLPRPPSLAKLVCEPQKISKITSNDSKSEKTVKESVEKRKSSNGLELKKNKSTEDLLQRIEDLEKTCLKQETELKQLKVSSSTPLPSPFNTPKKAKDQTVLEPKDIDENPYGIPDSIEDVIENKTIPITSNCKDNVPENDISLQTLNSGLVDAIKDSVEDDIKTDVDENIPIQSLVKSYCQVLMAVLRHKNAIEDHSLPIATIVMSSLSSCLSTSLTNEELAKDRLNEVQKEVWKYSHSNFSSDITEYLPLLLSTLQSISPHILLAKREDLLPLLTICLKLVKNSAQRDEFLHCLLFLNKRPDVSQRINICTTLISLLLPSRNGTVNSDLDVLCLISPCVKLIGSKYTEQRLMGAQCAMIVVMKFIIQNEHLSEAHDVLKELMESVRCCLLEETDSDVKEMMLSASALMLLLPFNRNTLMSLLDAFVGNYDFDRWQKAVSNFSHPFLSTKSSSSILDVKHAGCILFHMSLCLSHHREGKVVDLLEHMKLSLGHLTCAECDHTNDQAIIHCSRLVSNEKHPQIAFLTSAIDKTLPYLMLELIDSMDLNPKMGHSEILPPEIQWMILSMKNISSRGNTEDCFTSLRNTLSQEWFKKSTTFDFLENLLSFLSSILVHYEATDAIVVQTNINLFYDWTNCLGIGPTKALICPMFHSLLSMSDSELEKVKTGSTALTRAPFVIFTVSILGSQHQMDSVDDEIGSVPPLQDFLTRHINIICLCGGSLSSVIQSVSSLLTSYPETLDTILAVLWACLVNKSKLVRSSTGELWTLVATFITDEAMLSSRVVPALVTMATDEEVTIRASAIEPLINVANSASSREIGQQIVMKCSVQLETMLDDSQLNEHLLLKETLMHSISKTCSGLTDGAIDKILYNVLLPRLCQGVSNSNSPISQSMVRECTTTYSAVSNLSPPQHVIAHFIMPALQALLPVAGEFTTDLANLVSEYNSISLHHQSKGPANFGTVTASQTPSPVFNVKTRMSKMFTSGRQVAERTTFPNLFKNKSTQ